MNNQSGSSLFEALIATFLISSIILGLFKAQSYLQSSLIFDNQISQAEQFAFNILEAYPINISQDVPKNWNLMITKNQISDHCFSIKVLIEENVKAKTIIAEQIRWFCKS